MLQEFLSDTTDKETVVRLFRTSETDVSRNKSTLKLPYLRNLDEQKRNNYKTLMKIAQDSQRRDPVTCDTKATSLKKYHTCRMQNMAYSAGIIKIPSDLDVATCALDSA